MAGNWINQNKTKPERGKDVWIFDVWKQSVEIGYWDDWWVSYESKDDVFVICWMPMEAPQPPTEEMQAKLIDEDDRIRGLK